MSEKKTLRDRWNDLKQWAGEAWWRWPVLLLSLPLLCVVGVFVLPLLFRPKRTETTGQIDVDAAIEQNKHEQLRQASQVARRAQLKKDLERLQQRHNARKEATQRVEASGDEDAMRRELQAANERLERALKDGEG